MGASVHALVVDDDAFQMELIADVLRNLGVVDVTALPSGEQALQALSRNVSAYNLLLLDLYMPGMDGREATRILRSGAGPNRDTPVVAVTASATPKDWEACFAAGMSAHVAKPIDPLELYTALNRVLTGGVRVAA